MSSPIGRSTSAAHAASSPTRARSSARRAQRLGHRRPQRAARRRAHVAYSRSQPSIAAGSPVRGVQRRRRALAVLGVDEQAARRVGGQRRVGRDPPPAEPDLQAELVDDRLRQQAHEVRVARQARVDAGPRALGDRRAADVVAALEHEHRAPRARQVGGGDEAVVAAADDDGVVSRVARHQSANRCAWIGDEPVDVVHVAVELGDDDRVLLARLHAQPLDRRLVALGERALLGVGARDLRPRASRRRPARPSSASTSAVGRRRRRAGARG